MKPLKYLRLILTTLGLTILAACVTTPVPTLTPLQIQSLQTRQFEHSKEVVFRSVVSVFQDIGYTITSADIETGFISAEGSASTDASLQFLFGIAQISQTRATAFVEQIGDGTQIRLNFVEANETSSGYGQTSRQDAPILDPEIYQNAYDRIDTAIFIRSSSN